MAIQDGFSFNDAEYPHFDPEEYWGSREFKGVGGDAAPCDAAGQAPTPGL